MLVTESKSGKTVQITSPQVSEVQRSDNKRKVIPPERQQNRSKLRPKLWILLRCFCLFPLCIIYQLRIWWYGSSTYSMLFKVTAWRRNLLNVHSALWWIFPCLLCILYYINLVPLECESPCKWGGGLFVCFTSNHQPKPKALKAPNEGNKRRSRSQATKQNKSVGMGGGGGRRLILLGSYIMRLSGVKANEWPLFIWAKPCGSPEDSL